MKGRMSSVNGAQKCARPCMILTLLIQSWGASMTYHFVKQSGNGKTGSIPVTYSQRETCPESCPWQGNGCYAESWPVALHWRRVADRGDTLAALCRSIEALPDGQLWRHNVAGDLPGLGEDINARALRKIVRANHKKLGYTYTHKKTARALTLARRATRAGFAVNVSCDSVYEVDAMMARGLLCAVVMPSSAPRRTITPKGNIIEQCPATYDKSEITCADCKLCARTNRRVAVGFPAHGSRYRSINLKLERITHG